MTEIEKKFIHELEVFRTEAQSGIQFFYAYLGINSVIGESNKALNAVNKTPLFWKTNIGALQTAFFITLGRIFDKSSTHNIDSLLRLALSHKEIFSKSALAERKRRDNPNADEWLDEYLRNAYEPTQKDFQRLEQHVEKYRNIYNRNYRKIRNMVYAHKVLSKESEAQKLFKITNIRELEIIIVFLNKLYEALWQLLFNGIKPILRPMPYSVRSMKKKKLRDWQMRTVQQMIVNETQEFFKLYCK